MRLWARRRKDLTSSLTRVANRLHAVILELVPGGCTGEIYASKVARLLEELEPVGAVAAARKELAEELLGDLRRLGTQLAELKERLAAVVTASGTTTTKIFGVGPVVAAITVGLTRDVRRFSGKDHFAAYNGSAPIEVSSGEKNIYRLSMRGSRQLNHALHMAAVTQVRHRHSQGRAYYDKKIAEGKTGKEALRALKRRISDALFAAIVADSRRQEEASGGPGGQTGNGSIACAAGSHPAQPALRPSHSRAKTKPRAPPAGGVATALGLRQRYDDVPPCGKDFAAQGRRRYCSGACKQKAWREHHALPSPPTRPPGAETVYECAQCDARYLGERRCPECNLFTRSLGAGAFVPPLRRAHRHLRHHRRLPARPPQLTSNGTRDLQPGPCPLRAGGLVLLGRPHQKKTRKAY